MKCKFKIILGLILICLSYKSFSQTQLSTSTQSNAGGVSSSGAFTLTSTFGQPSPIGIGVSGQINSSSGYIYQAAFDATAPTISLASISPPIAAQQVTVSFSVTDISGVASATLFYRRGGDQTFTPLALTKTVNNFDGVIPASSVTSRGVEFYMTAADVYNNIARFPAADIYSAQVAVLGGVAKPTAQPAGSEQNAYRLISLPISATNKTPAAVLEDDLGAYNNTKWRFFELKGGKLPYVEYGNTSQMLPGKSFWLIVKDAGKVINTGAGVSNFTHKTYPIPLDTGWTFIGNPFDFDIPLGNLVRKSGSVYLHYYAGSWSNYTGALIPFDGYAISNLSGSIDTLFVNPKIGVVPLKQSANKSEDVIWKIKISAECKDAKDDDNEIVISQSAKVDYDELDKPEPPVIGEFVSVYFPRSNWGKILDKFCVDARPNPLDGADWEFEVLSNIEDKIDLKFDGLENIPLETEVVLIDNLIKSTQYLRQSDKYSFTNLSKSNPRKMNLLVGSQTYIQNKLTEIGAIPSKFELSQNFPNPFNPTTVIRYGLPSASHVTIKIYDLLGQEIKTLVDETQENGYRSVEWNGENSLGTDIASGLYFYRIEAADIQNPGKKFVQVKRMLLMK
ncbi:MAG: FlgD immunoglobulin-like domain containing protein [Bacteroidota bacterium]|nr:FlgD immunoglobulin-like domain containing protein [Bacteroidota bacterium]